MILDEDKIYYVYEWYNLDTGEIFYVGKGRGDRMKHRAPSARNGLFINYLQTHPNCSYRKIIDKVNEYDACSIEDKRIKDLKEQGLCSCNLYTRTSHRGCSYGKNNGMYGKHHTKEALKKMSLANLNGVNAGANNSQYGVSPKDRMDESTYQQWREKQRQRKFGATNPNAKPIKMLNGDITLDFDYISLCAKYLKTEFGFKASINSICGSICNALKKGVSYCGFKFEYLNNKKDNIGDLNEN